MSARTPTRPANPADGGMDVRLPWWALALPTLAFAVLLLLLTGPSDAQAASGSGALAQFLELVRQTLGHLGA
ncbi:hypothetical protein [Streptomyces sp. Rer75]|uniref:hypothetical protein n=1 Tax=unclassified Streptomyces TaxID=2593676 RepID=UPI0015D00799|nr:hypothetical protein [Streptomyces sp. Rer75]QLH20930.1 hypothetical protein HYQ63_10145 [Streptomyces sp. Rer75]